MAMLSCRPSRWCFVCAELTANISSQWTTQIDKAAALALGVIRLTGQSLGNLLVDNDMNLDTPLSSSMQHPVQTVLRILHRRTPQEQLRAQPPIQDIDGLASLLQGNGNSPHVRAAIDIPLDVVSLSLGSEALVSIRRLELLNRVLARRRIHTLVVLARLALRTLFLLARELVVEVRTHIVHNVVQLAEAETTATAGSLAVISIGALNLHLVYNLHSASHLLARTRRFTASEEALPHIPKETSLTLGLLTWTIAIGKVVVAAVG